MGSHVGERYKYLCTAEPKSFLTNCSFPMVLEKRIFDNSRKTTQSDANNIVIAGVWDCLLQHIYWENLIQVMAIIVSYYSAYQVT